MKENENKQHIYRDWAPGEAISSSLAKAKRETDSLMELLTQRR